MSSDNVIRAKSFRGKSHADGSEPLPADINRQPRSLVAIEFTEFTKDGGPLTKKISLGADGKVESDGSACVMFKGKARRVRLEDWILDLPKLIDQLSSNKAIGQRYKTISQDPSRSVSKTSASHAATSTAPSREKRMPISDTHAFTNANEEDDTQ